MKKILNSRGFNSGVVSALVISLVVVFNILLYTLTSLFGLTLGFPDKVNTSVGASMEEMFADVIASGERVSVTFCMDRDDLLVDATGKYVLRTAEAYAEKYDFIDLRYVNLLTQLEVDEAGNTKYVDLSKYKKDLRGGEIPLRTNSLIFSFGEGEEENYKVVTDTNTSAGFADFYTLDSTGSPFAYVGEEVFGAMLSWVITREHKVAYFTEGHGETADRALALLLSCAGYYIDTIDLRDADADTKLAADDCGMLIISNPITDFERSQDPTVMRAEIEKIETYLASGGNLYCALDPYGARHASLEGFLAEWGITLAGGEGDYGYNRDIIVDSGSSVSLDSLRFIASIANDGTLNSKIAENATAHKSGGVLVSDASRLTLSGGAEALLYTTAAANAVREGSVIETGKMVAAAISSRENADGTAANVVVLPSVLITNADVLTANGYLNKELIYSIFDVGFGAAYGIYGTESSMFDAGVIENLTGRRATVYTVILVCIPLALATVGAVITIKRKNR